MSLSELRHGRGTPMSIRELTVEWPLFWGYRNRLREREARAAEDQRRRIV